jgi:hypothetical protein
MKQVTTGNACSTNKRNKDGTSAQLLVNCMKSDSSAELAPILEER